MHYPLLIIGAGPAGYVAAIRAGQTGIKTLLVDRAELGGMCLNWGWIPSKAMLESAKQFARAKTLQKFGIEGIAAGQLSFNWATATARSRTITDKLQRGIAHLLARHGVTFLQGEAYILSPDKVRVGDQSVTFERLIIATGSRPQQRQLPLQHVPLCEIDALWQRQEVPANVAIIGTSPTAMELAQMLGLLGHQVHLLLPDADFLPMLDPYLSEYAGKLLRQTGVAVHPQSEIDEDSPGQIHIRSNGAAQVIAADLLINSENRRAIIPGSDIELTTENGFLRTNKWFQTNVPTIYAVGDVNGRLPLAHAASAQALNVVNQIQGVDVELRHDTIPINLYSDPEIAQVGKTEVQLQAANIDYRDDSFPLHVNGKALSEGEVEGFVRVLSGRKYGEVLGVQMVGANATDLIAEATLLMHMDGTVYDIAGVVHAHPTVAEVFQEVGLAGSGMPLHK
jgi:dihydrolipoamide dehydrogenase